MPESQTTVLGPECSFKGDLVISGPCRLLGTFEGSIRGEGELHIAAGASCTATIEVENIVIDGTAKGDILARQRLQIGAKASVQGDVTAGSLSVAEGASFVGRVGVGPEAVTSAGRKTLAPEVKPQAARGTRTADWSGEAAAGSNDWLGQSVKAPAWVKGAAGTDA